MTPQEKAYELRDKFHAIHYVSLEMAKEGALIAVRETITTLNEDIRDLDVRGNILLDLIRYWRNVEEEIEKL